MIFIDYNNLPSYIKENGLFCLWKYEEHNNKPTKVPYQPNGNKAQSNNPNTFTTFDVATKYVSKFDGLGISIFNGISAIDIDHCVSDDGTLSALAQDIVSIFDGCYTEKSPSGTGLRILFLTDNFTYDKAKYYINNQSLGLEVYVAGSTNKYVTITGDMFKDGDILNATNSLQQLLDKYMLRTLNANVRSVISKSYLSDEEVIKKATHSVHGAKFTSLWNGVIPESKSQSEADMALATLLAFWCSKDLEQMDRLFRQSGLMRDKWDRQQAGTTYGQLTLEKASNTVSATYAPIVPIPVEDDFTDETTDLTALTPFSNSKYPCTDIGNSNLFADYYTHLARYVPERKQWFVYNGKAWQSVIKYAM